MTKLTQVWSRIKVTKNDLVRGEVDSESRNAVARAVRRTLGIRSVEADTSGVYVKVDGKTYVASLPAKVLSLFDSLGFGESVSPTSFSIRFNVAK